MEPQLFGPSRKVVPPTYPAEKANAGLGSSGRVWRGPRPLVFGKAKSQRRNFLIATSDVNSPLQMLADCVFILAFSVVASFVYHAMSPNIAVISYNVLGSGLAVALTFSIVARMVTNERRSVVTNFYERLWGAALSWTFAFGTLTFALFAFKIGAEASRGDIMTFYFAGLPAIAVWRVFTPLAIVPISKRIGSTARECIIVGDSADPLVDKFAAELRANGHPDPTIFKFHAFCSVGQWPNELEYLANCVTRTAHHSAEGAIYVCAGKISGDRMASINRRFSMLPRAIYIVPDVQTVSLVRCKPANVGRFVVLEARREPLGPTQRAMKRLLDIVVSASALVILSPLLLITAALIKINSKGPVLFRQMRNGYCGRPFEILKFRSMYVLENGPVIRQAQLGDPRVTAVGRILRKFSIDELPQLVNILLGDMSLVGPRPHAQAHDSLYARSIENYEIRQYVKPGLTGWAQVNGLRGETATIDAMFQRIEYDLWYAVNASVLLDIEILIRTVIEVVRPRNAY